MIYNKNRKIDGYLKKKEYRKATEEINQEIAINLIRVHNLYSDVKYDEEKKAYIAYNSPFYGKNSKNEEVLELSDYVDFSIELSFQENAICRAENEEECKNECNRSLKLRKKVIKKIKSIK